LWLLLCLTRLCWAEANSDSAAGDLAQQIAAVTGPGVITLAIRNNSSIAADEIPRIRRVLLNSLTSLGVTIRDRTATDISSSVRVTLSQSARQGLWVAEIQQGPQVRVVMVGVPEIAPAAQPVQSPIELRKTLLISQTDPILDAELIPPTGDSATPQYLVVLSPEQIVVYRRDDSAPAAWTRQQTLTVAHERPWPRDVRGRLEMTTGGLFRAYLPGVVCSASQTPSAAEAGFSMSCTDSDDPWPVASFKALYNSGRNYFTGVTIPSQGAGLGPFYSAAELVQKRGTATVFTEVGSQPRLYDGTSLKMLAGSRDWGSDVAGVTSACGSGTQLLATASGMGNDDSLLAYEVEGRSAIPVSAPLSLNGSVTAMWSTSGGKTPSTEAIVILEKHQPLHYEAYHVSVVCSQ